MRNACKPLASTVVSAAAFLLLFTANACQDEPVYQGKTKSQWTKQLSDRDVGAKVTALSAVADLGPEAESAVPHVIRLFSDDRPIVRVAAILALTRIGQGATKKLRRGLDEEDEKLRSGCADALGALRAIESKDRLVEMLKTDPSPLVRAAAARSLGGIGSQPTRLLQDAQLLMEQAPQITGDMQQQNAIRALAKVGQSLAPALESMIVPEVSTALSRSLTEEGVSLVRGEALRSLMDIGPRGCTLVPTIADAINDTEIDWEIRRTALWSTAAAAWGDQRFALYRKLFESSNSQIVTEAVRVCGTTKGDAAALAADLANIARQNPDSITRWFAVSALTNMPESPEAIRAFVQALGDDDGLVFDTANDGLRKAGPAARTVLPELRKAFGHARERHSDNQRRGIVSFTDIHREITLQFTVEAVERQ